MKKIIVLINTLLLLSVWAFAAPVLMKRTIVIGILIFLAGFLFYAANAH